MMLQKDGNGNVDVRVLYQKRGDLKYISHLDMNRLMQRAFARAGLPVWYTQGFNPHLYLTFAQPLSLGFESDCEYMDLRLTEPMEAQEVARRLGAQMPRGLTVVSAAPPQMNVRDIASCDYEIRLETPGGAARALAALKELMSGAVMVEKKTKKGVRETDIRPMAALLSARAEDGDGAILLKVRCESTSETNLNPALLVGALCAKTGDDPRDASYLKTAVYARGGELFC